MIFPNYGIIQNSLNIIITSHHLQRNFTYFKMISLND